MSFIKVTCWDSYIVNKCCVSKSTCCHLLGHIFCDEDDRTEQLQAVQSQITKHRVPEKSVVNHQYKGHFHDFRLMHW